MIRNAWIVGLPLLACILLAQAVQAAELEIASVEKVVVPRVYQVDGEIEAVNASTLSAQTSGQVSKILFDVGDVVQSGDVIVVIDDTEQKASLTQAQANLKSAQAQLANAEQEFNRIREVYKKKVVSKSVMDKATRERLSARAGVDSARAALVQAKRQLSYTEVRAPYTGIVTKRQVELGEVVSQGQPLMSGIALERLRVNMDVPQSLIEPVRQEREAAVLLNGRLVKANKLVIFPSADSATDTFRVRADLPPGVAGVYPGMYVKVALGVGRHEVLAVPAQAVVYRSEVVGVYVLDEQGRVRLRHIRIGNPLADGRYVVLSGLDAGEQVAVDPQAAVRKLIEQRKEQTGHE